MADRRNTLELLHELIETCRDGRPDMYTRPAIINDPELKIYFTEQAKERTKLLAELTEEANPVATYLSFFF